MEIPLQLSAEVKRSVLTAAPRVCHELMNAPTLKSLTHLENFVVLFKCQVSLCWTPAIT